ncbi:MAG: PhzF family phenazine biosynthesis protein [Olsenella sp.]|nr:PhzF family phenazine biosynthesis protein [Olsenella sp.]
MRQYVVDAFTNKIFSGNQAAVCVVDDWPDDALMRSIATENNFSETAFVRPAPDAGDSTPGAGSDAPDGAGSGTAGGAYELRWFTPEGEIDFCGHATLASGFVVLTQLEPSLAEARFSTREVGVIAVRRAGDLFQMDFPVYELRRVEVTPQMEDMLGARVLEAWRARDLVCVLESAQDVRSLAPDLDAIARRDELLVHVTAPGEKGSPYDCVTRSFAPKLGIPEDPVCGSGHCHVLPYWADNLGKRELVAYQASRRGGTLFGRVAGDGRCVISGAAALFSVAELMV